MKIPLLACAGLLCWLSVGVTAEAAESPYLYGIHDQAPAPTEYLSHITNATGTGGWITATVAVGANPGDLSGTDFSSLANAGHTVICRINYGYFPTGTIPLPAQYDDFATRCKNFVASSPGCTIWLIGNELNLAAEWPFDGARFNYVSPQVYATCFRKVYNAIKSVHPNDKVIPQASAPWGGPYGASTQWVNGTNYPADGQPLTWVQYENQMLSALTNTGPVDGIALHVGSRGYTYDDIHSTNTFGNLGLYASFYVYKDWIDYGIPPGLYPLPLYVTECNGYYYWKGGHPENPAAHYEAGWMQEVYAEINRYNQAAVTLGKPIFRCVNLYRWCADCDNWNIDGASDPYKAQILSDLDAAAAQRYAWPTYVPYTNAPPAPTNLAASVGNALVTLTWSAAPFATSYTVRRATASAGPYPVLASNLTAAPYLDTYFTPNTTYYYRVSAANAYGESTTATPVSARPTNGLPDLVVTAVSWTPANLVAGSNVLFSATVKNQGSAATPGGVPLGVGFSPSDGGNYTWSGSFSVSLSPGASVSLTADGGNSGNKWLATPGPRTITANVDDVNRIGESLENNNTFSSNFTVFNASYALNAGGSAAGAFAADGFVSGGYPYSVTNSIDTSGVANAAPAAVYQSERWNNFTYTFGNLMPGSICTVRLHFAEIFYNAAGKRQFNVSLNGTQVLTNLDVFAEAGAQYRALVKQFSTMADALGTVNISFTQGNYDWPKVSGIEVIYVSPQPNTAPALAPIPTQFGPPGGLLSYPVQATDTNLPVQSLTYSLVVRPSGAVINATNGLFTWSVPQASTPLTNTVVVRVTDNGSPVMSDSKTFSVVAWPLSFLPATFNGSNVALGWQACPGKNYRVQYKQDLMDPGWLDWSSSLQATNPVQWINEPIGINGQKFFRIVGPTN